MERGALKGRWGRGKGGGRMREVEYRRNEEGGTRKREGGMGKGEGRMRMGEGGRPGARRGKAVDGGGATSLVGQVFRHQPC